MHIDLVLNRVLQMVVGFADRLARHGGEGSLGSVDISRSRRRAQQFATGGRLAKRCRSDRAQHFPFAAAELLNPARVAIQHLQHRQRAQRLGQLAGHLVGGREGHDGVEPHVILPAKCAGIGQRTGGDQRSKIGAGLDFADQLPLQLVRRRVLHQRHQRLQLAEREPARPLVSEDRREAEIERQRGADAADQHAPADIGEKVAAGIEPEPGVVRMEG